MNTVESSDSAQDSYWGRKQKISFYTKNRPNYTCVPVSTLQKLRPQISL